MSASQVITDLIQQYKTPELLFQHLESAEGGFLRVIRPQKEYSHLALIRYVKGFSDFTNPNTHYFRSVVWDTKKHQPVCFAPFRSLSLETLMPADGLVVEDFCDGTMVNMFWDTETTQWVLATRSSIGAKCRFYSQKTYSQLFAEAFQQTGLTYASLDKSLNYSWVLQHPENRIVVPVVLPAVHLVQVSRVSVSEDGVLTVDINPTLPLILAKTFTRRYAIPGTSVSVDALREMCVSHNSASCQGFVVKNPITGDRWKMRTSVYKHVKELRGNTPRLDYRWLELKQKGDLKAYMMYYPEDAAAFNALWERYKRESSNLYNWYCQIFKARRCRSADAPKYMRKVLYDLHDFYLNHLKPNGEGLVWPRFVVWFNTQDIPRQLFLTNFTMLEATRANQQMYPFEPTDENLVAQVQHKTDEEAAEADDAAAEDVAVI